MENQVVLSLGSWPKEAVSSHYKVSPATLRVIKNVKLQLHSLLPVSYAEFVLQNNLMNSKNNQVEDLYSQQLQRRQKKVQILKQIWLKIKSKRSKSAKQCQTARQSYVIKKQSRNVQRNSSRSIQGQKFRKKSKSPLFFQGKSPKHCSTYFDYYNTCQKKKLKYKNCEQQESTQSRRQLTNRSKTNEQYFNTNNTKMRFQSPANKNKQKLLNLMNQLLKKWSQYDNKHMHQLEYISDISDHQRRRLLKIHYIQKQKLRKNIQNLRCRIASLKKIKNFT